MTGNRISTQLRRMRRDWDRRARENARFYVATLQDQWSDEEFYRSGEADLPGTDPHRPRKHLPGQGPARDECARNRLRRRDGSPARWAGHFGHVYAVDISPEMVRQARRGLADFPNVRVFRNNGRDLSVIGGSWWNRWGIGRKLQLDFAFSCIVFQHIPNREIIESYVREVNRLLRPGGSVQIPGAGQPPRQSRCR